MEQCRMNSLSESQSRTQGVLLQSSVMATRRKQKRRVRVTVKLGLGLELRNTRSKGYRSPILWPQSRDEVWFSNVLDTRLVEDKVVRVAFVQVYLYVSMGFCFSRPTGCLGLEDVWAAQPVYKHEEVLQEQWKEMEDLTTRICWELVKEVYIAIWLNPLNNRCYLNRGAGVLPPLCDPDDNSDNVWEWLCSNVSTWPARLHYPPDRLLSIEMDAYISKKEIFRAESKYWNEIIDSYVRAFRWKDMKLRNAMDMRAGLGGFAAALHDLQIDCWIMNVVPVSGFNTSSVICDRELIGVMHDWYYTQCTLNSSFQILLPISFLSWLKLHSLPLVHLLLFIRDWWSMCNMLIIMLEMDRMLSTGGRVYIRDSVSVTGELQEIATAMGWVPALRKTGEDPHSSWKILILRNACVVLVG
ncbi:hypothetical protein REPUB_Repub02eG0109500 [Reevesia pubescens]